MVAVIDYGVGNLFSLQSSFRAIGEPVEVTRDPEALRRADRIVLPGVGAFADAAQKLAACGMDEAVRREVRAGKPVMGICLGMQLLFEKSYEYGVHTGLSMLGGEVSSLREVLPEKLKVPHIGWNALRFVGGQDPLFRHIREHDCVYFVHSFYARGCEDSLIATAEYGVEITAAVRRDNLIGCQFHPEKSGEVGLSILRAFCEEGD